MKIARLIITLDCNRKCHYCCNTPEMLASATHIKDLSTLKDYDEICITGGEPMLNPKRTYEIIKELNKYNMLHIYLYTALAQRREWLFKMLMSGLSGIHYTLHYNSGASDIVQGVHNIESLSKEFPTSKSFRLYIDNDVKIPVSIVPQRWSRVEVMKWDDNSPLPENETLFILDGYNE